MRVGTDIVEISRVNAQDSAFVKGVLSPQEMKLFALRKDQAQFLAGRFAAKEAFLKALGTGLSGGRLSEIDVSYEAGGAPILLFKGVRYPVSISHDGGYAISVVIIP